MQDLHNDLMREDLKKDPFRTLLDTAIKWSEYVLSTAKGNALKEGLAISEHLANYHYIIHEGIEE